MYNTRPPDGVLRSSLILGNQLSLTRLAGGGLMVGGGLWAARPQARAHLAGGTGQVQPEPWGAGIAERLLGLSLHTQTAERALGAPGSQ